MSNLLYMDESNGNGVYASKSNNAATATTTTTTGNNLNNIMNAASTAAVAAAAAATTVSTTLPTSISNEDLSQSLSEYTDADESISAPTEFLAEFLSAVMLKDYKKALKYCKLILQYEPNNSTAKEFYPLILEKLRGINANDDSDENYNKSSSPEILLELQSSDPSAGESDDAAEEVGDENYSGDINLNSSHENSNISNSSRRSSCCDSVDDSLSDDIDGIEDEVDGDEEEGEEEEEEEEEEEDEDAMSSSGDDLPNDDQPGGGSADDDGVGNADNGSQSSRNSSSGGGGRSRSDNTTHSYSSLLLEEEDDVVPINLQFPKDLPTPDLDISNGNKLHSTSCSDSESPTEPLTQRLAAILRSKCGVSNN